MKKEIWKMSNQATQERRSSTVRNKNYQCLQMPIAFAYKLFEFIKRCNET